MANNRMRATEQPRFFDSGGHQLYGVFHPAAHPGSASAVLVFCSSFGPDHVTVWRMEVLAARMMAARGWCVFSFHPRAHGDSTGNFAELTFDALVEDAIAASNHARKAADTSEIVWLGVGFGALVAAAAIRRDAGARALALWEPTHRCADFLRTQARRALFREVAEGRRPSATVAQLMERLEREGELLLFGERVYPVLFRTFCRSAAELDLARALEGWREPTFLAQIQRSPRLSADNVALASALVGREARIAVTCVVDDAMWNGNDPPWVAESLLQRTAEWLDGLE